MYSFLLYVTVKGNKKITTLFCIYLYYVAMCNLLKGSLILTGTWPSLLYIYTRNL
jgi:hypothetical protein